MQEFLGGLSAPKMNINFNKWVPPPEASLEITPVYLWFTLWGPQTSSL